MNLHELEALKDQIKNYVDLADESVLKIVHAILTTDADANWWDSVPGELKANLDESIYDADREGEEVTSYEQVKKEYPHWFMN
jgi:hypothetical protein